MEGSPELRASPPRLCQVYADSQLAFGHELAATVAANSGSHTWGAIKAPDVGCGQGGIAEAFGSLRATVTAVEPNRNRIGDLGRRLANASFGTPFSAVTGDGHNLLFPEGVFDVVIQSDLAEHMKSPPRVVEEAGRVVHAG